MRQRTISLRGGMFDVDLLEEGAGPPLLYLHGIWDADHNLLLPELAKDHAILAPSLPGFGASTGESQLSDVHDAIYYFLDLLDALGFANAPLIGHCLGGMFAAELAAVQPERFSQLVLIAPFGLWSQAHPVPDFFSAAPGELEALLGPSSEREASSTPAPETEDAKIEAAVRRAKAMSAAARFLWPLPNHGFKTRAHRVAAPTLLLWGAEDGICPPAYG
ncbi:MAG TPA: alpha/beta fold hydrolase, partial [Chloroflexota bacterium]|nr:alpha/beta fold hydrolase [Chloroflexota bacterium]